jgi:S1-C subfamily serine protease
MYIDLWSQIYPSVCSIKHIQSGNKIANGSGFIVNGKLITNNHVFACPVSDKVIIEFVGQNGSDITRSLELDKVTFNNALQSGSTEENWDYAILDIPQLVDIPSLTLCSPDKVISIGMPIALFGYQFTANHQSIHSGIISSKFINNNVKYIQIDASVNKGNSGGPLIDPQTGEVIGVITRAMDGLSNLFDELIKSFDSNIQAMQNVKATMSIGGIDPVQSLIVGQRQMQVISKEIKRSANVGIGYAFELDKIREFLNS